MHGEAVGGEGQLVGRSASLPCAVEGDGAVVGCAAERGGIVAAVYVGLSADGHAREFDLPGGLGVEKCGFDKGDVGHGAVESQVSRGAVDVGDVAQHARGHE